MNASESKLLGVVLCALGVLLMAVLLPLLAWKKRQESDQ